MRRSVLRVGQIARLDAAGRCLRLYSGNKSPMQAPSDSNMLPGSDLAANDLRNEFTIVSESKVYSRYLHVFNRRVQYPDGNVHEFDVCGHPKSQYMFAVVFPFNTRTRRVTVVREFSQGCGKPMFCFPSGGWEPTKHNSLDEYVV